MARWSWQIGGAVVLALGLLACTKDVQLPGTRFPAAVPLEDSLPTKTDTNPQPPAPEANKAAAISLPRAVSNGEWTHRGGSARHAGPHGVLSAAPQLVWSGNVGSGNSRRNRITASPVVSGGRVFAMDSSSTLTAFSTGGGTLWSADLSPDSDREGGISGGGLAVEGGRVFATTGFGELLALDAASGGILWRQRLGSPVSGAPTVSGKAVYAVGRDGAAVAVSVENGKELWHVPGAPDVGDVQGASSPVAGDGQVIFPFPSGQIMAVNPIAGERQWSAAAAGLRPGFAYTEIADVTGDPVLVGNTLYVGTAAGWTMALDASTGATLWATPEGAMNPPLVVGGSVFVVNDQAMLVRMSAASGEVIWKAPMPYYVKDKPKKQIEIYAHYGPVLAGGHIAVTSSDGLLRLFDATNGTMISTAKIPGGAASAPALAQGLLFVMGGDGQLHAFR